MRIFFSGQGFEWLRFLSLMFSPSDRTPCMKGLTRAPAGCGVFNVDLTLCSSLTHVTETSRVAEGLWDGGKTHSVRDESRCRKKAASSHWAKVHRRLGRKCWIPESRRRRETGDTRNRSELLEHTSRTFYRGRGLLYWNQDDWKCSTEEHCVCVKCLISPWNKKRVWSQLGHIQPPF